MDMVLKVKRLLTAEYGELESFDVKLQPQLMVLIQVAHDAQTLSNHSLISFTRCKFPLELGERRRSLEVDEVLYKQLAWIIL